ncbi:MAG: dTDP-4-dehydrorhamnose reductase [Desulfovibrionaceae bacterium]|nr:dTDP-4-dehydrorhamnose reductase [Desulfovibrionaceae bacterium]
MRILVTGGKGMLARTLAATLGASRRHEIHAPGHGDLDVTSAHSVSRMFAELRPEVVLHCAAHTKVDKCEDERDLAFAINDLGSANVARACTQAGARLVAFSTDYVFDGAKDGDYTEFDQPNGGLGVYGQSKWAGECAVRLNCPNHIIARVSWLYGPGGPSFVHTMLRLHRQGVPLIRVVSDQIGNPTSTPAVAAAVAELLEHPELKGTFHLTCEGAASWYDFAREIFALAGVEQRVEPCTTAEYPTRARRPANSCLAKTRLKSAGLAPMPQWQAALRTFLAVELPELERQARAAEAERG